MAITTSRLPPSCLSAGNATLGYGRSPVIESLDVEIPQGAFTAIVGANASGKSTLLRGLSRLLKPRAGTIMLDGRSIADFPTREVASRLAHLPQMPPVPEGVTVADLVARGRYPHQSLFLRSSTKDQEKIAAAMEATNVAQLSHRKVDELSGGQRQRVWLAMVLAQETELLLLDEPTTFLDIAHQIEQLELLAGLNRRTGKTIVAVLHDLNQACRYATHLIAMCDGKIVAEGPPAQTVTAELVQRVFGLSCILIDDPVSHTPLIVPTGWPQQSPLFEKDSDDRP